MALRLALFVLHLGCLSCLPGWNVYAHGAYMTAVDDHSYLEVDESLDNDLGDAYDIDMDYWGHQPPVCSLPTTGSKKFCVFTDSDFAGGRGISMVVRPGQVASILNLPAFSQPGIHADIGINQLNDAPFFPHEMDGRGVGLIANRTIQKGEWLMSFTTAFMMDRIAEEALTWQERRYFQRLAFDRLPSALRSTSYELYGQEGSDAADELDDILMTNTFGYSLDVGLYEEEPTTQFRMLFPEIARFNHACRPSADCFFDPATLTQHIYAARNIFAGEEITINYIPLLQKREDRLQALNGSWGFACDCKFCTANSEVVKVSDSRVERILQLQEILADHTYSSRGLPGLAHELVSLIHQEEAWPLLSSGYAATAVEYSGIGDMANAKKHAELALANGHLCNGAYYWDEERENLIQIKQDPRKHWTWKFRSHVANAVTAS